MESDTQAIEESANFGGLRVVAFESRMAAETQPMIERHGGVATVAPSMREVPLEDNHAALDFARAAAGRRVRRGHFSDRRRRPRAVRR